ncbi:hypothetical protein HUS23_04355 [Ectothiorhodospiraceae bacterium 2226]|nr:hypothetical protein HUS23_04355 [Ectothiorhodospiraceae bacterium 2226]
MKYALCALLCAFLSLPAVASPWSISAEAWAMPRHGERVLQLPAVAAALEAAAAQPDARLTVRYPGGEAGTLWAQELRGWLIALGLDSDRVELVPGAPRRDVVELELRPAAGAGGQ